MSSSQGPRDAIAATCQCSLNHPAGGLRASRHTIYPARPPPLDPRTECSDDLYNMHSTFTTYVGHFKITHGGEHIAWLYVHNVDSSGTRPLQLPGRQITTNPHISVLVPVYHQHVQRRPLRRRESKRIPASATVPGEFACHLAFHVYTAATENRETKPGHTHEAQAINIGAQVLEKSGCVVHSSFRPWMAMHTLPLSSSRSYLHRRGACQVFHCQCGA